MTEIKITLSLNEVDYKKLEIIAVLLGKGLEEAAKFLLEEKLAYLYRVGVLEINPKPLKP